MAKRAYRSTPVEAPVPPNTDAPSAPCWDVGDPQAYRHSPARELQLAVDALFSGETVAGESPEPHVEGVWSARRSLAFMVGASTALWAGVGVAAFLALR